ncbi:MAG: class I SAM-dependent methyltransferase [Flavobacteriales bacterium]
MAENKDVEQFYDGFSRRQNKIGINIRHYAIVNKLVKFGLKENSTLLEAGCGVGTITQLLAKKIKSGSITAFDISQEGVEITKSRVKDKANIQVLKSDLLGFSTNQKFDFILFADVLEHIPSEELKATIEHILKFTKSNSSIVINIPDPAMNDYLRMHRPDKLQIIDNSVYVEDLIRAFDSSDFKLVFFEQYALHHHESDYNFMVFRQRPSYENMRDQKPLSIILAKTVQRLKYLFS